MAAGRLYVISAPSGTGKTTLVKRVLAEVRDVVFSVSYTTRDPRPGEKEGVDYHFVSRDDFQRLIRAGALAEWTEIHGSYYGTPRSFVEECLSRDVDVMLDIDTHGAEQIRKKYPEGVLIFILPPGMGDLRERLRRRGSESQEMIDLRLRNATKEIEKMENYDYVIINRKIDEAVEKIKAIIIAERCKRSSIVPKLREARGKG